MKDVCSTFSQITNDIYLTSNEKVKALVTQSCLTLCDPMDCSSPGSSVHGILQARILEWVAIPFSRESSWPRIEPWSPALQRDFFFFFLLSELLGKPHLTDNSLGFFQWERVKLKQGGFGLPQRRSQEAHRAPGLLRWVSRVMGMVGPSRKYLLMVPLCFWLFGDRPVEFSTSSPVMRGKMEQLVIMRK